MADIILTEQKTFLELINDPTNHLESGIANTINMNGFKLIADCDAVNYPVTILNSGELDVQLEFRNGSRIELNASLPAGSVHPWVDPDNPLPESNYEAGFLGNASVEVRLNGNFGLGGGECFSSDCHPFWKFLGENCFEPCCKSTDFRPGFSIASWRFAA